MTWQRIPAGSVKCGFGKARRTPNVPLAASSTLVDNRDGGDMDTADRLFWSHLGLAADTDLPKVCGGHEDFDPQRIDLRQREDRTLFISILAGNEKALDHDAVDWASQRALFQNFFRMGDFQARNLAG